MERMSPEWFEDNAIVIPIRNGWEPSGLTIYRDGNGDKWLYLVSDDRGKMARLKLSGTDSSKVRLDDWGDSRYEADEMEAITTAGNLLMVGIEQVRHDEKDVALIKEFDPANRNQGKLGSFTGNEWILPNPDFIVTPKSGLEALTFVPDGAYPPEWGSSSHYG